jgi:murein DD-endopeptidase MepM/ murein hydrolase activator NlpD
MPVTRKLRRAFGIAACLVLAACGAGMYGVSGSYHWFYEDKIPVVMPANAPRISQQFHNGGPDGTPAHPGMDVWAAHGTPIIAAAPGRVVESYYEPLYGHRILIDHGKDETGTRVFTAYYHLSERGAQTGQSVARGEKIGEMGATGALGLFVHLHFEVRRGPSRLRARQEDPQLFWVGGPGRVTCFEPDLKVPALPFRTTYPVACRPS